MKRNEKRLWNAINSLGSGDSYNVADGGAFKVVAKITSSTFNSTALCYDYSWQALKRDGSNSTDGGSGTARCIQERGVDMTGKSAMVANNTIVYIYREYDQFQFSAAGGNTASGSQSPLWHSENTENANVEWYSSEYDGTVPSGAQQNIALVTKEIFKTYYDNANDLFYQHYRLHYYDSTGKLIRLGAVQSEVVFVTTLLY